MCRTSQAVISVAICGVQMLVRCLMTIMLMIENLLRLILQTLYNFISFVLQLLSLLPICCVFIISSRLKCFMCGGGGPCPVNRGGGCDCLMSLFAIIILFFIFRATGVLDKIFYSIGYQKAPTDVVRFIPTPGEVTECSRNDTEITEYELDYMTTEAQTTTGAVEGTVPGPEFLMRGAETLIGDTEANESNLQTNGGTTEYLRETQLTTADEFSFDPYAFTTARLKETKQSGPDETAFETYASTYASTTTSVTEGKYTEKSQSTTESKIGVGVRTPAKIQTVRNLKSTLSATKRHSKTKKKPETTTLMPLTTSHSVVNNTLGEDFTTVLYYFI